MHTNRVIVGTAFCFLLDSVRAISRDMMRTMRGGGVYNGQDRALDHDRRATSTSAAAAVVERQMRRGCVLVRYRFYWREGGQRVMRC